MKRWEFLSRSYEIKPNSAVRVTVRDIHGEPVSLDGRFKPDAAEPYVMRVLTKEKKLVRVAYARIISIEEV